MCIYIYIYIIRNLSNIYPRRHFSVACTLILIHKKKRHCPRYLQSSYTKSIYKVRPKSIGYTILDTASFLLFSGEDVTM